MATRRRHKTMGWFAAAAAVVFAGVAGAGCGEEAGDAAKAPGLSGEVSVEGSSTLLPIMQAAGKELHARHKDVKVTVDSSGTAGGFDTFCRGETDIATASRLIKEAESAACITRRVEYIELEVATDGVSMVVNTANKFASCLTLAQLQAIWAPGSTIDSWKDVDPSFPDRALTLYGPGTDSGTFDFFTRKVQGTEGVSRTDYTASEEDDVLVRGVAEDDGALGYFGYSHAVMNEDRVRALGVDPGDGCITPTTETIETRAYKPFSRPLYLYVSKAAAAKEEVQAFVDLVLDDMDEIAGDIGYVPPSAQQAEAARATWDDFVDGR